MTLVCRACGKENPDGSRYCNACGRSVETPSPPEPSSDGTTVCNSCGAANPLHMPFCRNCAASFPEPGAPAGQHLLVQSGRRCQWCGAPVGGSDDYCAACRDRLPAPAAGPASPSRGPTVAAALFTGAGVLDIAQGVLTMAADGYVPEYGMDFSGFLDACGALFIIFGIFAFVAAVLSFRRQRFGLAVLAGALAIIGMGPYLLGSLLSLIGLILVVRSRGEF